MQAASSFGSSSSHRGGMLRDMFGTPEAMRAILSEHVVKADEGRRVHLPTLHQPLEKLGGRSPLDVMAACSKGSFQNKFIIIGGGTSYHAALVAEYLIETIARVPVEVQYASEYRYRQPLVRDGDVFVVVSSSGETTDCVESLRCIKQCSNGKEVLTLAVVNASDSTIAKESDAVIDILAGSEVGVASTKAFSCTVTALVLLAATLGEASGKMKTEEQAELLQKLEKLPDQMQALLEKESQPLLENAGHERLIGIGNCAVWDIGCQNVLANNFIFLGRGFNFPIALEGAMKLKEIAYIHAEGYPAAEMKHGPIALIDQFMPVVIIAPKSDETYEKIKSNIEEVKARNGSCIVITEEGNTELQQLCEHVIYVPSTHEFLMPLLTVVPLQLLAYIMGVVRGNEVDRPRGLKKSITDSFEPEAGAAA